MDGFFLNDWEGCAAEDVFQDFDTEGGKDIEIIIASYTCGDYSGDAFVLYLDRSDGKLYEVNGSHCSCFGLEGQWEPEEVSVDAMKHRIEKGWFPSSYKETLVRAIAEMEV